MYVFALLFKSPKSSTIWNSLQNLISRNSRKLIIYLLIQKSHLKQVREIQIQAWAQKLTQILLVLLILVISLGSCWEPCGWTHEFIQNPLKSVHSQGQMLWNSSSIKLNGKSITVYCLITVLMFACKPWWKEWGDRRMLITEMLTCNSTVPLAQDNSGWKVPHEVSSSSTSHSKLQLFLF